MKPEEILSLTVMLVILILLALFMTKISRVERQLSGLRAELDDSSGVPLGICISRWVEDLIALEEVLICIEDDANVIMILNSSTNK